MYILILILICVNFFAVLSVAPNDEDAIRCKVVALIKCDSIDKALSTIHSAQRQNLPFDFSYFKVNPLIIDNL